MSAQIPAQDNALPSDAFSFPKEGDFSSLGWSQTFFAVHDFFSRTYFGDWKKIPWDRMAAYYGQKIVAAEASGDRDTYRIAMVEYLKFLGPDLNP